MLTFTILRECDSLGVRIVMNNPKSTSSRILDNRKLGIFVAETCARYMDEFIPMDTGMLAQNYITEPFRVTYTSIYASRQFYGDNFNFSKEMHPNATSHWDKAMQDAKINQVAKEVTEFLKRS